MNKPTLLLSSFHCVYFLIISHRFSLSQSFYKVTFNFFPYQPLEKASIGNLSVVLMVNFISGDKFTNLSSKVISVVFQSSDTESIEDIWSLTYWNLHHKQSVYVVHYIFPWLVFRTSQNDFIDINVFLGNFSDEHLLTVFSV